jgi:glycosyltransferase involved in cell wall biosynthesis
VVSLKPKITIIIPSYNSLKDLPHCIDNIKTVLKGKLGGSVVIHVQDGNSNDGTKNYLNALDLPYLTFQSAEDLGVYDAMNRAVQKSTTDWVYFMGADDRLLPDFGKALMQLTDIGRIYYGNVRFASTGKRYDGRFTPLKLVYRNICHQSMFFPTHLLQAAPYSLRYRTKSDWASNIKFIHDETMEYIECDVAIFQDQNGLSSTQEDPVFDRERSLLFRINHGRALQILARLAPAMTAIRRRAVALTERKA